MITADDILQVALCFTDRSLTEGEKAALTTLCEAADRLWDSRLRDEVDPEEFKGIYCLACAYTALGNFQTVAQAGQSDLTSYRLGDFSVTRSAESTVVHRSLQAQAEALMAPFTIDGDFAFLEVGG